jgi:para-nitrobenzyl esterase
MSAALDATTTTIASTEAGKVLGTIENGIHVFKGIPYGGDTAPVRFGAPTGPKPWSGVKECIEFGHKSPQPPESTIFGPVRDKEANEDCLVLNVWTPGLKDGRKRPVMVWFHGGGFTSFSGSNAAYEGVRLATRGDVVVVTVNHRLGVVGYLYLAELGGPIFADSGNAGMLDLVRALEWVRDNIEEFGGDPGNVLIFGESGGGAKVSTLMAMPSARGLFHKAVVQSGSMLNATKPARATAIAKSYLEALKLPPDRAQELRTMPLAALMAPVMTGRFAAIALGPVHDGGALPRHPFDPDAPAQTADVPMLIGTCKDETTLLMGGRDPSLFELSWEALPERLAKQFPKTEPGLLVDHYRTNHPDFTASDVFFAATCDFGMWKGAVTQAERKSQQGAAPAFMYQFDYASTRAGGRFKATHADEIVYVFDTVSNFLRRPKPEAQKLADEMSEAWIAFARTGKPATALLPDWPPYDVNKRATMIFNRETKLVNDPRHEERRLFGKVSAPARRG